MTEVTNTAPTVIPKGDESREVFFKDINEIVGLRHVVQSAADSEKNLLATLVEEHMACNENDDKAVVKKMIKGIVDEHVKCTISNRAEVDEATLADYETAKKHLKG